jgi:hypothetical protein
MTRLLRGALALLALAPSAHAKELAPFRADLVVAWGRNAGSDAFRDDVARVLARALATSCFAGVNAADRPPATSTSELTYTVILSNAFEELRFDDSIAGALQPGEPTKELRRVAYFEVTVEAALTANAGGALIHRKHLLAHAERRPIYVGEDPQAYARDEATRDLVQTLTKSLGCGGTKLLKKIREALPH